MLILQILIVIVAIVLIASVMMQDSDNDGVSSLMGGGNSDTFFGKNQGSSLQSKMAMVTKISAGLFVVLALVILIVTKSNPA